MTKEEAAEIAKKSGVTVTPNKPTISQLKIRGRIQGQFAYASGDNSNTGKEANNYSTFERGGFVWACRVSSTSLSLFRWK